jgi:uroporphyrinogen-III decarboxylase
VHFEESNDIEMLKREVGATNCISGIYPARLLVTGTKQQVVDEAKRIMDVFAPGGGYVFDFDGGVYDAKRENVEALFECIKDYGKY